MKNPENRKKNTDSQTIANKTARDEEIRRLVSLVKNNDTVSFVTLLGHFSQTITVLASSFSLPNSEHEDLCQEGRMALYRAAMSYDGKSAKFSTYAVTCMTNAMINFSAKYKSTSGKDILSEDMGTFESGEAVVPGAIITERDLEEMLKTEGFAGLSEYERRVMSLKLSGYKVREIAKKLSKESKSVENTLFRARAKLRAHIDG